ncbi:MAG: hypothetical protein IJ634_06235 [Bacteroidales bacterium]|nr:hypothetical protein [Bacteroidales bacterium]
MFTAILSYVVLAGLVYYGVKGAWELLKFACKAAVWVVGALFTVAESLVDYVRDTISTSPEHETQSVYITDAGPLNDFIKKQLAENKVKTEDGVLEISRRLDEAEKKNEKIIMSEVKDASGKVGIANPKFVQADKFESNIQDALDNGQIYQKKVKLTN